MSMKQPARKWMVLTTLATLCSFALGCAWLALMPAEKAHAHEQRPRTGENEVFFNARYLQARLEMETGAFDAARGTLEPCISMAACPPFIYTGLAQSMLATGDIAGALAVVEQGLKQHPDAPELLHEHARLLRETGRIDEAIADLEHILESQPNHQEVLETLSELHLSRLISHPEDSEKTVEELIDLYTRMLDGRTGTDRLAPLMVLSTLHQRREEYDLAVERTAEAMRILPGNDRVQQAHATALVGAGRVEEAIEVYANALVKAPDNEDMRRRVEALLLANGGEERRARFFIELSEKNPTNAGVQQVASRVLMRAERWDDAEACLRRLLESQPDDLASRLALLQIWTEQGRVQETVEEVKRIAAEGNELAPAIVLAVAQTLESSDHRAEAIDVLETYYEAHPEDENVAIGLVSLLIEDERNDRAAEVLEAVRKQSPGNFTAAALLAEIYSLEQKFHDAHAVVGSLPEEVLAANEPGVSMLRGGLYLNESIFLQRDGKFDEARDRIDRARRILDEIRLTEDSGDAPRLRRLRARVHLNEGLIAQAQERFDEAEAAYRKATEVSPEEPEVWNTLGYFLAQTNQKLDEALGHIQKAMEMSPDSPHIVDSLGWVLYRQGKYDEALEHLKRAAEEMADDPGTAEVYDHLGDCYAAMGRHAEAREAWQKAIELYVTFDIDAIREKLSGAAE